MANELSELRRALGGRFSDVMREASSPQGHPRGNIAMGPDALRKRHLDIYFDLIGKPTIFGVTVDPRRAMSRDQLQDLSENKVPVMFKNLARLQSEYHALPPDQRESVPQDLPDLPFLKDALAKMLRIVETGRME